MRTYVLESAAGYAAFGKGDFQIIAAQDRAMDSTDPGDVFAFIYRSDAGSNYAQWADAKKVWLAQ